MPFYNVLFYSKKHILFCANRSKKLHKSICNEFTSRFAVYRTGTLMITGDR